MFSEVFSIKLHFESQNMEEEKIRRYSSHHKILLVGEGDFSFSLCLARAFGSAVNMVATSLDSRASLMMKYSKALRNLNELENLGCTIVCEVDAHTMTQHPLLQFKFFDRIIFNFPHAGFYGRENDNLQISLHQNVVSGFLSSAKHMLTQNGEVHVTHKTGHPFSKWEIEKLASYVGLGLVEKVPFKKEEYPGYDNKRGEGPWCDLSFPVGQCSTFKFRKRDWPFCF